MPGEVQLNIRETFFSERVVVHWNKLPREMIKSLSLEVSKKHDDMALRGMVVMGSWLDCMILVFFFFPISTILWFYEYFHDAALLNCASGNSSYFLPCESYVPQDSYALFPQLTASCGLLFCFSALTRCGIPI